MRGVIPGALGALALCLSSMPAYAGGVVITFREIAASAAGRGVESVVLRSTTTNGHQENANSGVTTQSSSSGTESMSGATDAVTGASSTGTSGAGQAAGAPGGGKAPPGVPVPGTGGPLNGEDPTSAATASVQSGSVTRFAADDGVADFEAVGCGGATSARGPLGLLPFAVAALALLRRRR